MINHKLILGAAIASSLLVPTGVFAQHIPNLSDPGFDRTVEEFSGLAPSDTNIITAIETIVNAFLAIIALVAVIVIIFAGFRYITSGGDEDAAATAKNQIIFAVIGLVIILLAAVIVNFVIGLFPATAPAPAP